MHRESLDISTSTMKDRGSGPAYIYLLQLYGGMRRVWERKAYRLRWLQGFIYMRGNSDRSCENIPTFLVFFFFEIWRWGWRGKILYGYLCPQVMWESPSGILTKKNLLFLAFRLRSQLILCAECISHAWQAPRLWWGCPLGCLMTECRWLRFGYSGEYVGWNESVYRCVWRTGS